MDLCRKVKFRDSKECLRHRIKHPPLISCRVTQSCLTKRLVLAGGCPRGQYSSALPSCFSLEAARAWKGYDDPVSRDSGGSDGSSKQENGQPAMRVRSIHFVPVNSSEVVFMLPPLNTL